MDKTVFLDFDGVVANSLPALYGVYAAFLTEQGASPRPEEFDRLNGPALPEIVTCLKEAHGLGPRTPELLARYAALRLDAYAGRIRPFADVSEVLERLTATGRVLYLVTASERGPVQSFLEHWHLARHFRALICGEDVVRAKPAPDIYRLALERSASAMGTTVAVEDSVNGVRAAVAAGLRVLAVNADPGAQAALAGAGAWKVVARLGEALEALEDF